MQTTTVKDFLAFWPRIAGQGLIAKPAAANYKNAASTILTGTDTPEDADVKDIDVDKLFRQFENLNATKYKPDTISVIESRFRRAHAEFLRWAENPKGFEPQIGQARKKDQSAARKNSAKKGSKKKGTREQEDGLDDDFDPPADGSMITYPLPLRPGVIAKLMVPADLTKADVTRINLFLNSAVLPVEDEEGGAS